MLDTIKERAKEELKDYLRDNPSYPEDSVMEVADSIADTELTYYWDVIELLQDDNEFFSMTLEELDYPAVENMNIFNLARALLFAVIEQYLYDNLEEIQEELAEEEEDQTDELPN